MESGLPAQDSKGLGQCSLHTCPQWAWGRMGSGCLDSSKETTGERGWGQCSIWEQILAVCLGVLSEAEETALHVSSLPSCRGPGPAAEGQRHLRSPRPGGASEVLLFLVFLFLWLLHYPNPSSLILPPLSLCSDLSLNLVLVRLIIQSLIFRGR